jgi:hypothetical protein
MPVPILATMRYGGYRPTVLWNMVFRGTSGWYGGGTDPVFGCGKAKAGSNGIPISQLVIGLVIVFMQSAEIDGCLHLYLLIGLGVLLMAG